MQKIVQLKPVEGNLPFIPINGTELCLLEVDEISGTIEDGELGVYEFGENSRIYPPTYTFGYNDDGVIVPLPDLNKFGEIFDMDKEDTKILSSFVIDTASQLSLRVIPLLNGFVIVNTIINNLAKSGKTYPEVIEMSDMDRDIKVALGAMGQATLLGEIVKTGIKRFNTINLDNKVIDIVNIIKTCRFIDPDGNVKHISLTGVENMLSHVKDMLFVSPEE